MVFNNEAIDPLQHPDAITNTLLIILDIIGSNVYRLSNWFSPSDEIPVSAAH
jgi:hypothetical protein